MKKWLVLLMSLMLIVSSSIASFADSTISYSHEDVQKACSSSADTAKCERLVTLVMDFLAGKQTGISSRSELENASELIAQAVSEQGIKIHQVYELWAYDKDGNLKWHDGVENLVTTEGLNKYLDCTLKTGCSSPAWYMCLVTGPGSGTTYALGDTLASHAGWTENTDYTGNRKAITMGSISSGSVDNSANKAAFSINNTATIAGACVTNAETGTSGTLLGANDFTGGDRSVISGDTINGQVTFTISN